MTSRKKKFSTLEISDGMASSNIWKALLEETVHIKLLKLFYFTITLHIK